MFCHSDDSDFIPIRLKGPVTVSGECKARCTQDMQGRELPYSNITSRRIQTKGTNCRRGEGQQQGEHTEFFQQWSTHFLSILFSETSCSNVSADHYLKKKFKKITNRARLAGSKNEDCYELRQLDANSHRNMLFCALARTKHDNLISFGKPWAQPGWQAITVFLGKNHTVLCNCRLQQIHFSVFVCHTSLVTINQSHLFLSSSDMFEAWCSREWGIFLQNRLF